MYIISLSLSLSLLLRCLMCGFYLCIALAMPTFVSILSHSSFCTVTFHALTIMAALVPFSDPNSPPFCNSYVLHYLFSQTGGAIPTPRQCDGADHFQARQPNTQALVAFPLSHRLVFSNRFECHIHLRSFWYLLASFRCDSMDCGCSMQLRRSECKLASSHWRNMGNLPRYHHTSRFW